MADSSSDDKVRNYETETDKLKIEPTIVGGRPLAKSQSLQGIPRGIEVLIKKASVDPEFRSVLLEKRAGAAAAIQLELSAAESALLNAIPAAQIEKIIENARVPDEHRRLFLGKVAAAMLAVLGIPLSARAWEFCADHTAVETPYRLLPHYSHGDPKLDFFAPDGEIGEVLGDSNSAISHGNGKWLVCKITGEATGWISLSVKYSCPFKTADISVRFRNRREWPNPQIAYDPMRSIVHWGKGEVTFCANGKGRGETDQLVIALRSCENEDLSIGDLISLYSPPDSFLPGEYLVNGRVVWKIVKHSKTWSAE